MTTRYSLPPTSDNADTARSARALAALVLVIGIVGLCLLVAFVPDTALPVAASPDAEAVTAQTVLLGA